uniref:PLAC domain-containing protein n=1 Tax=Knipowitschia caucasica TaxID=637954 RepID=A0AAV2LRS6_KNICA
MLLSIGGLGFRRCPELLPWSWGLGVRRCPELLPWSWGLGFRRCPELLPWSWGLGFRRCPELLLWSWALAEECVGAGCRPRHRGRYCLGERSRYRVCNPGVCAQEQPSFRDLQCSHFNSLPYKGQLHSWVAVYNRVSPCELHCRPLHQHFSEKMRDAAADGNPVLRRSFITPNAPHNLYCMGYAKSIGCDLVIDSSAVEDRCGVCNGNGSTCATVHRTFDQSQGLGYVDMGLIPEGSWDIRIEEVAEAANFLALRSDSLNKYFLNGGWTIQWNGEYKAAGAVFSYQRSGQKESLTSPGPTTESLWIQLLFQESNPGVRYEFTINQNVSAHTELGPGAFYWKHGSWSDCSVTCGSGVQRQALHCVERSRGIVDEQLCDPETRPQNNQSHCDKDPCAATWWVGEWQRCSSSCGPLGASIRAVLCVQSLGAEGQKALQPTDCEHMPKPKSVSPCSTHVPCPSVWSSGDWSQCSVSCGSGTRWRNVSCSRNTAADCDLQKRPPALGSCHLQDCPVPLLPQDNFDWSGSGWTEKDVLNEIIPEAKPPAKFATTTKAQPRTHQDTNDIDFHYHNNVESADITQEKPVQVDDFYYDYNFIDFHEDLSDDEKNSGSKAMTTKPPSLKGLENSSTSKAPSFQRPTKVTSYNDEHQYMGKPEANDLSSTKAPADRKAENTDNFLAEDFLLPVSTTHSPPLTTPSNPQEGVEVDTMKEDLQVTDEYSLEAEDNYKDTPTLSSHLRISRPEMMPTLTTAHITTQRTETDLGLPPTLESEINIKSSLLPDIFADYEYSEIPYASMTTQKAYPDVSQTYPTTTAATFFTEQGEYAPPAASVLPSSPSMVPQANSYWITGNWSECSTSCGLGAVWRSLSCSTGLHSDCDPEKRPVPAQRCYLRPCSTWNLGPWTKCSRRCGGGLRHREVQCFDMRDARPLRPFHCRAMSARPPTHSPCNLHACLDWDTSSWGQCSEVCGGGQQQRIVTCPEEEQCDPDTRPDHLQTCNKQPCAQWLSGSWGSCSASCGGGLQHRLVKCVDTKQEAEQELDPSQCSEELRPRSSNKCELQPCHSPPPGTVCVRDRLSSRFCQTLRWLGRCSLANVRSQCCRTCNQRLRTLLPGPKTTAGAQGTAGTPGPKTTAGAQGTAGPPGPKTTAGAQGTAGTPSPQWTAALPGTKAPKLGALRATVHRELQTAESYSLRGATDRRELQSAESYSPQRATVRRELQSVESYSLQRAAVRRELQSADSYRLQRATVSRELPSAESYSPQIATVCRELQSADSYRLQRVTVSRELQSKNNTGFK